jgi:hypothetical protein
LLSVLESRCGSETVIFESGHIRIGVGEFGQPAAGILPDAGALNICSISVDENKSAFPGAWLRRDNCAPWKMSLELQSGSTEMVRQPVNELRHRFVVRIDATNGFACSSCKELKCPIRECSIFLRANAGDKAANKTDSPTSSEEGIS